jgi:AmiR/NasT family two-component response regulator
MLLLKHYIEAAPVQEAIRAGVTSYIVKPFQPATLKAHIHICLRTWR